MFLQKIGKEYYSLIKRNTNFPIANKKTRRNRNLTKSQLQPKTKNLNKIKLLTIDPTIIKRLNKTINVFLLLCAASL